MGAQVDHKGKSRAYRGDIDGLGNTSRLGLLEQRGPSRDQRPELFGTRGVKRTFVQTFREPHATMVRHYGEWGRGQ